MQQGGDFARNIGSLLQTKSVQLRRVVFLPCSRLLSDTALSGCVVVGDRDLVSDFLVEINFF